VRRKRRRRSVSGNSPLQVIAGTAILGVGIVFALVAAGEQMHHAYRENRSLLASPFP
jgi:hypothetical protein